MDTNLDPHDTSLVLGLGYPSIDHRLHRRDPPLKLEPWELDQSPLAPSLALTLQAQPYESRQVRMIPQSNPATKSSSSSLVSSFSKAVSDEDEDGSARKKLRLTKDQSALLEERFKDHTTLNPKQKQALAKQLNLRPRQVEVWFQNRRARTKMKQTEAECEALKRRYERLAEENRSLQRELRELKAFKLHFPFYMQSPTGAALTMCPSCNRVNGGSYIDGSPGSNTVGMPPPTKPRLLKAFTRSSAF